MKIYLVRHGESLGNVDEEVYFHTADHAVPLSPRGVEQAKKAGEFLTQHFKDIKDSSWMWRGAWKGHPRMWVSPYKRAIQTADEIHNLMGAERLVKDRREHILLGEQQFGLFDGIPEAELPKQFPTEHAYYQKHVDHGGKFWAPMPMGESRFNVAKRVHQAFGTFHRDADRHGVHNLVIVAHGTVIRAFVMMWLHKSVEWFENEPNPENCSIRLIDGGKDLGYIYEGGD